MKMADQIVHGVRAREFHELLAELDHGRVNQRLTEFLAEVTSGVAETSKTGEITLTLKVKKEGEMAAVTADVKIKRPEHPMHGTLMYFGTNNTSLHRENPRQLKLREVAQMKPPRPAGAPKADPLVVDDEDGPDDEDNDEGDKEH